MRSHILRLSLDVWRITTDGVFDMHDQSLEPILVSVNEGKKAISVGHTKFYELIREGKIRTVTIGRRRLVEYASLKEIANV